MSFVVWHFTQKTLSKTAQADLCISCINGGSTRAKKAGEETRETQSAEARSTESTATPLLSSKNETETKYEALAEQARPVPRQESQELRVEK